MLRSQGRDIGTAVAQALRDIAALRHAAVLYESPHRIGDTLADPDDIRPLPAITIDDPAISMTIGTNTSPMVGKIKGHKLTARMVKDRLDRELVGNVSLKVVDIGNPAAWEVQGRGELALTEKYTNRSST